MGSRSFARYSNRGIPSAPRAASRAGSVIGKQDNFLILVFLSPFRFFAEFSRHAGHHSFGWLDQQSQNDSSNQTDGGYGAKQLWQR